MTEEELKIKFDHIQGIFNRCINHASQVMIDNIASKSLYFDEEQADKLEQQEYVRTADELVQLYIRYSVLNDIQYFYSVSDFFWESGFYESLKSDEKRKYMSFNPLSFDYSRYEQDNTVYDEELPYFSVIVKTVVLEKYSAYLRKKKSYLPVVIRPKYNFWLTGKYCFQIFKSHRSIENFHFIDTIHQQCYLSVV